MANVVFDFDGTLADTFPAVIDVAYRLSPRTRRLPPEAISDLRRLPLLTALRQLGIPLRHMPLLILFTRRRLKSHMQEMPPYDGVEEMLKALHKHHHRLYILTSNYRENVEVFLHHQGLDKLFADIHTVAFATTGTKTRALKRMMRQYNLKADETYHVGNEALDMRSAEKVGIRGVATTWGGFDLGTLRKIKPFAIIEKPAELVDLVK